MDVELLEDGKAIDHREIDRCFETLKFFSMLKFLWVVAESIVF